MSSAPRSATAADRAAIVAVEDRLNAALAVLRVVVTLNMLGLTVWRWDNFVHPGWALVVVGFLVLWTAAVLVLYRQPGRRVAWLFVADLAVTATAMALSPWLKGEFFRATVPGFWVMGALLVWAIHWHWRGGLVAGLLLSAVDYSIRADFTESNYGNVFLLITGGTILGFMCQSLKEMAVERARAERSAAVARERTRLARAVHDGVLQVLALVQRRGGELGGDFAELGRLAAEQELALRALIRAQDTLSMADAEGRGAAPTEAQDLGVVLERLGEGNVTVVTPGVPVELPVETVQTLRDAVCACLDNVRMHVGLEVPAWILLEAYDNEVTVSVRDEGPGIPEGRLAAAEQEGRMGVTSSIRGRLVELGGTASVQTGAWGTEWELTVPLIQEGQGR